MPDLDSPAVVVRHTRQFLGLDISEIVGLFKEAINEWLDDKAPRLGAALAFYTLLSIAPLLVIAVSIAGLFFGRTAVEGELFWQIQGLVGSEGATAIQGLLRGASQPVAGVFSATVGIVVLLVGASSVVTELGDALNTIWKVPSPPVPAGTGFLTGIFRQKARAFAIVAGTGFLLLVSLLVNTTISALGSFFNSLLPMPESVLRLGEFLVAFCVTTAAFAAIYKIMPAVRLTWTDVFVGACVTSLLFTAGKELIGIYLGKAGFASSYGAAGSLVAVLVWVYYSAQLFFLGAEFTKVYARRLGSHHAGRR